MNSDDYTVLSDYSREGPSHREIAKELLPKLREEIPEDEYADFVIDLQNAVLETILEDLSANLKHEDWHGMGFDNPEDFLSAEDVSEAIGDTALHYFEEDQTGKSHQIFSVILDYAEEYDLIRME